ncbi:MAG: type I restriction endonuclease subunit R [Candidatus Sumerlaeia bacterium]|nr:type I restriction endonuclease subunit R [Candidatus Sumerlaeia bacterium]
MTPLFSEDALIEQPAIALFSSLGWDTANCFYELPGPANSVGRETTGEVVLGNRLLASLHKLNPDVPEAVLVSAIGEMMRDRGAMSLLQANADVYGLLKNGFAITMGNGDGDQEDFRVRYIDWETPEANDFFLASQFWVSGDLYKRRADLVGFVNGIPLLFMELKASHKNIKNAFDENLSDYKDTIPQVFWYNAFIILSNGSESNLGTISSEWEHFFTWKKINDEGEEGVISLETMIKGTCKKSRFLDLVENFTLFQESKGGSIKLVSKNHQFHGVNRALQVLDEVYGIDPMKPLTPNPSPSGREAASEGKTSQSPKRLGVFWHTQGSGKSFSMLFFSQKVLRKKRGNWTFVIVTDRTDLDDQIYKNFARCGAVTEPEHMVRAASAEDLKQKLREDHRYVFTLIQKFRNERGKTFPMLSDRDDVIVITDEAHRSQYDIFAQNMRDALPNAAFIGFTGTPLIDGQDEVTKDVFGDYISVYNFKQSIDDGATVPLYYENRIPELQLTNANLTDDMYEIIENADLDEDQEGKLEREFKREYHLITRDDRLDTIAGDVVQHFLGRGHQGKAMMICVDKVTTVRMYEKVKKAWKKELSERRKALKNAPAYGQSDEADFLKYMEETDMAVVVSADQNEIQTFKGHGIDIKPIRKRMVTEDLDEKFKDSNDPLRLVFVCAMWITGFDVPSCSTIYLDKPLRNHTLMQTIARANRVFPEKNNGVIVDYIGVFKSLEKALSIYGAPRVGSNKVDRPANVKDELIEQLELAVAEARQFCENREIDLQELVEAGEWNYIALRDAAVDKILVDDETRREFLKLADRVVRLHKASLPDKSDERFRPWRAVFSNMADRIRSLVSPPDISAVIAQINALLDRSISAEGYRISTEVRESEDTGNKIDLSQIDFDALRKYFESKNKNVAVAGVRAAIEKKLDQMVRENKTRIDFVEEFQRLIAEYNSGSANVEVLFAKLQAFAEKLSVEEQRHIREKLSEEELAIFDLLMRPRLELSDKEEKQVKAVAKDLLERLKSEKLVLDWKKRQQARASVRLTIEQILDQLPRAYTTTLYEQKCDMIFQHIFENYHGQGTSVYA